DAAVTACGRLDIMVNNAGVETRTSLLETTEEQYDRVLGINLKSAFFGSQMAARQMIKQGGGGRIINITSVHEDWPMPDNIAYCLSTLQNPALLKKLDEAIPLGRLAQPEEIARGVACLADDGASYRTATTAFACGGLSHTSRGLA